MEECPELNELLEDPSLESLIDSLDLFEEDE